MPEFLHTPAFWFSLFGLGFTIFAYFHKLSRDAAQEAQAELTVLKSRVGVVEDVDKTALPRFLELEKEHRHLHDRVFIYQEQRIEGIVKDNERERELNAMKFLNNDREFKEIKDCIKEIKEDFKKNTDKILDKLEKLNTK